MDLNFVISVENERRQITSFSDVQWRSGHAWCWVRDSLEWSGNPTGVCDFVEKKLLEAGKQEKHLIIFLLAGVAWLLWKTRNDWDF